MDSNKDRIYDLIKDDVGKTNKNGLSAGEIAKKLDMHRSNVSCILNELYREGALVKIKGKPVLYTTTNNKTSEDVNNINSTNFDMLIGSDKSLKKCIQQAKAAILYPPKGLHTLILGPTGVGKTMFAELMYKFSMENKIFKLEAPFVAFNCADYSNNPELLMSHLFGCKKGAFTGADKDREGIVAKSNGGVLFLDEVHRLPPEGQEMLFYLIDKGLYTPLGGDEKKECQVLIICATTEDIDNVLLSTFNRRIPMNIKIPALKDRSLEERFELICEFFKIEAARIKRDISVSDNTIRQLLLYDCPGNVGQLKSDIQLGCANAFLNSISKQSKKVEIHCTDFASYVNQGLLIYKNYAKEVDKIVISDKFNFTSKGKENNITEGGYSLPDNFYEGIEKRMQDLHKRGVSEEEIKMLIEFDIENYFKHFIRNFENGIKKGELSKIVDEEIIYLVEGFLNVASKKLQKIFPTKIFYGLCLHISSSIKRIKEDKNIVNHNLKNIKENYKEEFNSAKDLARSIEDIYNIKIPEDEIGFIAMFLTVNEIESGCLNDKPIVVIAMHGRATASSMAEVVNKLVGANNVYAYDMSLDKSSKSAYIELKELIEKKHQGAGVMLLVDMGSLGIFGELIKKDTGIDVKVIDMVSTPIAIECSRKAIIESDINNIYNEIKKQVSSYIPFIPKVSENFIPNEKNIIITLCTTGEGSAIKLKNLIENRINLKENNVEIFPMSFNNKQYVYDKINKISKDKNIIAIVGTINPNMYGIPYISTYEVFMEDGCNKIKNIINEKNNKKSMYTESKENHYGKFIKVLEKEITNIDVKSFEKLYKDFSNKLEVKLVRRISYDISVGLMIHMLCCISNIVAGRKIPSCYSKEELKKKYRYEFVCIKESVKDIEEFYNIKFSDDELCFMLRNIMNI